MSISGILKSITNVTLIILFQKNISAIFASFK